MDDAAGRRWRVVTWLYVLWGVLHVIVGAVPLVRFFTGGSVSMLSFHEFDLESVEGPMVHASHLIAEHSANLIAFGLLAIIVAVTLVAKGRHLGVWLNAVVLGIVDISFVVAEIATGHLDPMPAGIGPLLYLAAVAASIAAVRGDRRSRPSPPRNPDRGAGQAVSTRSRVAG